jgi:hypothetical protein
VLSVLPPPCAVGLPQGLTRDCRVLLIQVCKAWADAACRAGKAWYNCSSGAASFDVSSTENAEALSDWLVRYRVPADIMVDMETTNDWSVYPATLAALAAGPAEHVVALYSGGAGGPGVFPDSMHLVAQLTALTTLVLEYGDAGLDGSNAHHLSCLVNLKVRRCPALTSI